MKIDNKFIKEFELIIKESGKILLTYYGNSKRSLKKQGGYVTQADLESEDFLKKNLVKLLPNASFWAEESGKSGKNDYCFVIDPLDGTTNFSYSIPYFCISVALTLNNKPVLGAIYDPLRNEFFHAQKGKGAFLNWSKIHISKETKLKKCLLAVSFPCGWEKKYNSNWKAIEKIRSKSFAMRLMGAAALDLAHVACGRFDATFFQTLKWWDIAAGILIIEESGGVTSEFSGKELTPEFESFVAGSVSVHGELVKLLN